MTKMDRAPIQDRDSKEITSAAGIAKFHGFKPITPPTIIKQDLDVTKNFGSFSNPSEKAALIRIYFEEKMMAHSQPLMFYCERPFPGSKESSVHRKSSHKLQSSLISMGSSKSVCECLSIQTAATILNSVGYKNLEIHINSVGDKDSMNEFHKKLTLFIRKNFNAFPADLRQATKKDPFAILKENKEEWKNWIVECPKSLDFLSETSRLHFKEVLEFLEIMDIPYTIDHHLVSDPDIGSETVFSIMDISDPEKPEELAYGFRFNRMAKKIGYKKEVPSTMLSISAKLKKPLKKTKVKTVKSQFYLVQFGLEAKLRSFLVLKELFKAGANVCHAIAKDKLSSQMGIAEASDAEYIILIGQKEALENSVVIRNTATRAQEIVPIRDLSSKAKELF